MNSATFLIVLIIPVDTNAFRELGEPRRRSDQVAGPGFKGKEERGGGGGEGRGEEGVEDRGEERRG